MKKHWIVLFILVVILGTLAYISTWTVDKVQVEGCEIVNTQSVSDAMKEEAPLDNTLLLYIKSKMNKLKDLSFVSKMDLELTDKNTVTVTVYEKSIAGCVLYKGDYVYFDKDGIVLDSSKRRVGSAPLIKGLTFTEWSIGKKLPSDDDKKWVRLTSMLAKESRSWWKNTIWRLTVSSSPLKMKLSFNTEALQSNWERGNIWRFR